MIASQRDRLIVRGGDQLESLHPATIVFIGQGAAEGYIATGGPTERRIVMDNGGNLLEEFDRAFRVRKALLDADAVVIVPKRSQLTSGGRTYRVDHVVTREGDDCVYLACKHL